MAGLHQKTGKMAAGDGATVRQSQRPFPGAGDPPSPGARQSSDRAAGAALLLLQQGGHRWVCNINIQTHNMNLVILPEGEISTPFTRVKGNPARAISSRAAGIAATLSWSVIAKVPTRISWARWTSSCGVSRPSEAVVWLLQIVNHCVLAVAQKDSCWTST